MFLADTCAFFNGQLSPQIPDPNIKLNVLHLTCAPPMAGLRTLREITSHAQKTIALLTKQPSVRIVKHRTDLENMNGKIGVVLGIQAPPEDANLSLCQLRRLKDLGILFTTLAYDFANPFGAGFAEPHAPLTERGRKFMEQCCYAGLVVDLSHAGHRTASEAVGYAHAAHLPTPVITHAACYDVYPHLRNFPDQLLATIAEAGGFIGVLSLTSYLHETAAVGGRDTEAFCHHVVHATNVCGPHAVCIGSDGYYKARAIDEWRTMHEALMQKLDPNNQIFRVEWPDQPIAWNRPDRMVCIAKKLRELLPPRTVEGVVGLNFLKFLKVLLP